MVFTAFFLGAELVYCALAVVEKKRLINRSWFLIKEQHHGKEQKNGSICWCRSDDRNEDGGPRKKANRRAYCCLLINCLPVRVRQPSCENLSWIFRGAAICLTVIIITTSVLFYGADGTCSI